MLTLVLGVVNIRLSKAYAADHMTDLASFCWIKPVLLDTVKYLGKQSSRDIILCVQ